MREENPYSPPEPGKDLIEVEDLDATRRVLLSFRFNVRLIGSACVVFFGLLSLTGESVNWSAVLPTLLLVGVAILASYASDSAHTPVQQTNYLYWPGAYLFGGASGLIAFAGRQWLW